MPHTVLLNNVDHQQLRIITTRGAAWGDDVMTAVTFPAEFRNLLAHYPIVFRKLHNSHGMEPVALLGLREGENLFLRGEVWDTLYRPLAVERLPFYIGRQGDELLVHIDLEHPRVSKQAGEPLFRTHGGSTAYLERMNSVLLAIHLGLESTPALVTALLDHELLEPFVFEADLADGTPLRLHGYYTIHEDRLRQLGGAALQALSRAGHLQSAYLALASLSQLRALVQRLEQRLEPRNGPAIGHHA